MIETFTAGMDLEAFREDPKTIAAVERKLQVNSEAAIRLGETAEARCPGLPWRTSVEWETGCVTSTSGWSLRLSGGLSKVIYRLLRALCSALNPE
jgi:hypothetical protein